jgi:hypothetical protein
MSSENIKTAEYVASTLYRLIGKGAPADQELFTVWVRDDRLIIAVNANAKSHWTQVLNNRFARHFSLVLQGRKVNVVQPDQRGVYIQVAYMPTPASKLESSPLDVSTQPSPVHVPIGMTKNGPLWIDFVDGDSYLIGGSRGMGKTTLLHAWIQSLMNGGEIGLYLWDGKNGAEFARYEAHPLVVVGRELQSVIGPLKELIDQREAALVNAGVPSIAQWNTKHTPQMNPVALFIDEAAFVPVEAHDLIKDLVARGRSYGVHPVIATQRPGVAEVQALVKANLTTRIAFPVPSVHESGVILGRKGAEKLSKRPGMLLMYWRAREVRAQAFSVHLPNIDSQWPTGQVLEILKHAREDDNRVTAEILQQRYHYKPWTASRTLDTWRAAGWIFKNPERKNGHYLTPKLCEWLEANHDREANR